MIYDVISEGIPTLNRPAKNVMSLLSTRRTAKVFLFRYWRSLSKNVQHQCGKKILRFSEQCTIIKNGEVYIFQNVLFIKTMHGSRS